MSQVGEVKANVLSFVVARSEAFYSEEESGLAAIVILERHVRITVGTHEALEALIRLIQLILRLFVVFLVRVELERRHGLPASYCLLESILTHESIIKFRLVNLTTLH